MEILIKPVFGYTDDGNYFKTGISSMANDVELSENINSYFDAVFLGEDRKITRLPRTNYYIVHPLPGETITDIDDWFNGYLERAVVDRGFVDMMDVEVEPHDTTAPEGRIDHENDGEEDAQGNIIKGPVLYMTPLDFPIPDFFNFTTEEGRVDIMRYIDPEDSLDQIQIDHLFANKRNFMGLSFNNSILNNASFVGALFPLGTFIETKLKKANFSGADLRYANLTKADLTGANFQDANLTGASFDDSNWKEAVNLIDNPTFTAPARHLVLEQEDAEDDEALEGDKNTCYAVTDLYDKNIDKYLAKDPGNFILIVGDNKECESLVNLKRQYYSDELRDMEGYYECSQSVIDWQNQPGRHTKIVFNPEDYITDVEYVKVGSYNQYIIKPDWFYDGPAPEPRMFKLVSTGERKRLISKRIATLYGTNVVSDVHCDPKDTFEIFRLEPVFSKKSIRRKSTKRKSTKRLKTRNTIKSRNTLNHRTKGRILTAADETTVAGGGRKKKRTLKKRTLKRRTLKKRLKRN
jgi:hypothetical protein